MTQLNQSDMDIKKTKAKKAFINGDFDQALVLYTEILQADEKDTDTLCNVGLIYLNQHKYNEAEDLFNRSIEINPKQSEAFFNLGCLYQEKNQLKEALEFFKQTVLINPKDYETYLRMGLCTQTMGNLDDTQAFFEEAFRLKPDSKEIGAALTSIYLEKGMLERAEEVLQVNLVSFPEDVNLNFSMGLIQKDLGKYESALAKFNRVVNLNPNHAEGFYHLAECCVQLDLLDQAEPFYANACKLDSALVEPILKLGELYEKLGKDEDAKIMYRHWIMQVTEKRNLFDAEMKALYEDVIKRIPGFKVEIESLQPASIELPVINSESERDQDYRMSLQIDDD